jgi:hypothetical protein
MRLTPDCDAVYVDSRDKHIDPESEERIGKRCFDIFSAVVWTLQDEQLLSADLEFDKCNLEKVVKSFWARELDVYVDGVRYCSDCRKKYKDRIHCYVCDKCVLSENFSESIFTLKTCDVCYNQQKKAYGPPKGVYCFGIGPNKYSFTKE